FFSNHKNEASSVQRLVAAENAVLVEGDAAVAGKIGLDVGSRGDPVVQIDQAGDTALERLHPPWKGVAQPFHDLEQRKIDIGYPAAGEMVAAIALQQPLEIAEIFRHPRAPEVLGALFGGLALILIIQRRAERVMG